MDKAQEVKVVGVVGGSQRIQIELSPRLARMLISGHENVTENIFKDIREALEVVDLIIKSKGE